MSTTRPPGKIITFYSYKGGTGRSLAVANVAWILAANAKSVLVLDWDLEAPGLHRYFRPFLIDKELTSSDGIIDFVIAFADEAIKPTPEGQTLPADWYLAHADITKHALGMDFEDFPKGGKIDLVPAGRQGPTYAARVNSFDWKNFYVRLAGKAFLEEAKRLMRSKYDYILIDSRTGVADTAGICTVQMPDVLAVCFTFNNQSIEGAAAVTQSVEDQRNKAKSWLDTPSDQGEARDEDSQQRDNKVRIVPIPMRVDSGEKVKLERRRIYARKKFDPFLQNIGVSDRDVFWGQIEVPYIPYYSYEELLAAFTLENPNNPSTVLAAMIRIANHVTGLNASDQPLKYSSLISPEKQQEILEEFASTPGSSSLDSPLVGTETEVQRQIRLAELAFLHLNADEQLAAQRLWTRLVRIPRPEERGENSIVQVSKNDLPASAQLLIPEFADRELLVLEQDPKTYATIVRAASEGLLRNWPRLQDWIKKDLNFLLWRQQLRTDLAKWKGNHGEESDLLHGRDLDWARGFLKQYSADLNREELEYIETSLRRKERISRRLTLAASLAALLILIVAGTAAWKQWKAHQQNVALANQLALAATKETDPPLDLQLRLLLAIESMKLATTQSAEEFLRKNLPLLPRHMAAIKHEDTVDRVVFSPDGSKLTTVSGRFSLSSTQKEKGVRAVRVWRVDSGAEVGSPLLLNEDVLSFIVSPTARYVATLSSNKNAPGEEDPARGNVRRAQRAANDTQNIVRVWEISTGSMVAQVAHTAPVFDWAFSPDELRLATVSEDHSVLILNIAQKSVLRLMHDDSVIAVAFSFDGGYLATGSDDATVRVWHAQSGMEVSRLSLDNSPSIVAFSPDGKYLVTATEDSNVAQVWDWAQRLEVSRITHSASLTFVDFSPDGKLLATSGDDNTVRLWDWLKSSQISIIRQNATIIQTVFSYKSRYLAAVAKDNVVRIWRVDNLSQEMAELIHTGNVNDVDFSSDEKLITTAGSDAVARVWSLGDALQNDFVEEGCARLTRNLTRQEWQQYFGDQPYRRTCQADFGSTIPVK